jgi:hypothetical protein
MNTNSCPTCRTEFFLAPNYPRLGLTEAERLELDAEDAAVEEATAHIESEIASLAEQTGEEAEE